MDIKIKKSLLAQNKKVKSGVAFTRRYIVFFNFGSQYSDNYAVIESKNKEQALHDAWFTWGRKNVAKVEVLNEYSEKVVRLYGKSRII